MPEQPNASWEQTTLWAQLKERCGTKVEESRRVLQTCLPPIENILHSGGTGPSDFTLHDEQHAFRVAERMIDVIPRDVLPILSELELALLLLSAYLHDIGMTPERGKVKQIFRYLETGNEASLTLEEKEDIQEWLDNTSAGVPGKIPRAIDSRDYSEALELIVAHYCRHKHNDWSEDWIRKNLNAQWRGYIGWLDDLVQLCRSHHYGYSELRQPEFDPKLAGGSPPSVVHRRYLACVLRIADILEFDPERTPDIVFTHRSITSGSAIYWRKDHYIELLITGDPKHIFVNAEPPNARVHRAILEMADQIDSELTLCQRLAHEVHFEKFGPLPDLKHTWDLPYVVDRRIEPKAGDYVYIDGAFRPNTQKILELLSGRELYGSPFAAVRELLQNGFDATKELIAREILTSNADTLSKSVVSDRYAVELRLQKEAGRLWLTCLDEGVGMSKRIIENYFLVSGSAKRHDILDLERRCQKLGLRLGRTGQFGIGVLSYFMIADQVTVSTRRHGLCGDSEPNAWTFETEGVGTFGELRRASPDLNGTRVKLRLRNEITEGDAEGFLNAIRNYIRSKVVRVPCILRLSADFLGVKESYGPGWMMGSESLSEIALSKLDYSEGYKKGPPLQVLSSAKRKELEQRSTYWRRVREEAKAALKWQTLTGDLPSNVGAYRISIPYFELAGGSAFGFLRTIKSGQQLLLDRISQGLAYIPQGHEITAWRGMRADSRTFQGHNWLNREDLGIREIDWEASEAGSVSINRDRIEFSTDVVPAMTWLRDTIAEAYRRLAGDNRHGAFSALNYRILNEPTPEGTPQQWRGKWQTPQDEVRWEDIVFPATTSSVFAYTSIPSELSNQGMPIAVLPALGEPDDDDHYDGISWNSAILTPDRVLIFESFETKLIPIWDRPPSPASFTTGLFLQSKFPDEWGELAGAEIEHYSSAGATTVWNVTNALTTAFNEKDWRWVTKIAKPETDPLSIGDRIMGDRGKCAAWLGLIVSGKNADLWRGLAERDPSFLESVWNQVFGEGGRDFKIKFWVGQSTGLRILTPKTWAFSEAVASWQRKGDPKALNGDLLPAVGPRWVLTSEEQRGRLTRLATLASGRLPRTPPNVS